MVTTTRLVEPQRRNPLTLRPAEGVALASASSTTKLRYTQIRTDGGTQMRAGTNEATAGEYADELRRGALFPPVVVFFDGSAYWLGDGFHRVRAYFMAYGHATEIPCEVRPGTRRDAVLCAAAANAVHGLRRSNADKRRAVETLLRDEEWGQWSDREIARRCQVSHNFVSEVRRSLSSDDSEPALARIYTTRHGTVATMKVSAQRQTAQQRQVEPPMAQVQDSMTVAQPSTGRATLVDGLAVQAGQGATNGHRALSTGAVQDADSTMSDEGSGLLRNETVTTPVAQRNERVQRLLELYWQVSTSLGEYSNLTGYFVGAVPLRRALEPMLQKLQENLP